MAACGVTVEKIRILARHSSDTILRYVREAPLKTLRRDLGLLADCGSASASRAPVSKDRASATTEQLRHALARVEHLDRAVQRLSEVVDHRTELFLFNKESSSVHRLQPSDSGLTACGWHFTARKRAKGSLQILTDVDDFPWWALCDKCLQDRRSQLKAAALYSISDSE